MVKRVRAMLDSSKTSGLDCTSVVVFDLKFLTYWLISKSLLDSCFCVLCKVSLLLYGSETKNYCPVSLLSAVSRIFEEPMNYRAVEPLEKSDIVPYFQHDFWTPH